MKRMKLNKRHLWNFYVFPLVLFTAVACYPTGKPDIESQHELRDEKHFANGTVIGRYSYTDNEGNPIQVKYYADDASYGVELKSIKVVDATGQPLPSSTQNSLNLPSATNMPNAPVMQNVPNTANSLNVQKQFDYNILKNTDPDKITTDIINNNFPTMTYKYKNNDPYDFLNKEVSKTNRYKVEKTNPDYEIFYQNELKGPKKCTKEKVRVYFDKERKIRNAINNFEADKFCEQF